MRAAAALVRAGIPTFVVPDAPRDCPLPLNRRQTGKSSAWIVGEQIRRESEAVSSDSALVIVDRTPIYVISHLLDVSAPAAEVDVLVEIARAWSRTYDV